MASELEARQETEWQILYDRIVPVLERYGKIGFDNETDFWLVDDNLGRWVQKIETHKLTLLEPAIVKQLQDLLAGYPDWEIWVVVIFDAKTTHGLIIAEDEIIDELQRDLLPPAFRDLVYPGSKPPNPNIKTISTV